MRYQLLAFWIFYWLRNVATFHDSNNDQISIKHAKRSSADKIPDTVCSSNSELLINACLQVIN